MRFLLILTSVFWMPAANNVSAEILALSIVIAVDLSIMLMVGNKMDILNEVLSRAKVRLPSLNSDKPVGLSQLRSSVCGNK